MGYVLAVLSFVGWAFATVLMRGITLPLPTMVCVGYAIGASVMLLTSKREGLLAFVNFTRRHPWRVALQVLAYAGTTLTYHWSIKLTSVANAALTHSAQPIFTCLLFAPLLAQRWPGRWTWLSVLLGFAGLYVALYDKLSVNGPLLGIALGTFSAVTYSIGMLQIKFFVTQLEQRSLMAGMMTLSFLVMLPYALHEGGTMPDLRGLLYLLGYALLVFVVANGLFFAAGKRISEAHLATLGYVEPVAAIGFAALFLSEPLTPASVIGGAMVLGSGLLLGMDLRRAKAAVTT